MARLIIEIKSLLDGITWRELITLLASVLVDVDHFHAQVEADSTLEAKGEMLIAGEIVYYYIAHINIDRDEQGQAIDVYFSHSPYVNIIDEAVNDSKLLGLTADEWHER